MTNAKGKEFLFIPCSLDNDNLINQVAILAREIWVEHFTQIIGIDQVNYMLTTLQSPKAIKRQIKEGYNYYLIGSPKNFIGYFSWRLDEVTHSIHLSKLHILSGYRRRGIATDVLRTLSKEGLLHACSMIWLTVNKNNSIAITAYENMSFCVTDSLVIDISEGFVMDDYRMEKII